MSDDRCERCNHPPGKIALPSGMDDYKLVWVCPCACHKPAPEADQQAVQNKIAAEWLEAREVIAKKLEDYGAPSDYAVARAEGILARLATAGLVLTKAGE